MQSPKRDESVAEDFNVEDRMVEESSVLLSGMKGSELRRDLNIDQKALDVLFWIKNLEMQWKVLNSKLEAAYKCRKQTAKEELSCGVMATIEKQKQVAKLSIELDHFKQQSIAACVHAELSRPLEEFSKLQTDLERKVKISKDSMVDFLQNVPLVRGTVLGDGAEQPDLESFVQTLSLGNQTLQKFTPLLSEQHAEKSPRTRYGSYSSSPNYDPLRNLEVTESYSGELQGLVQEEIGLMKEIEELLVQKRGKQLQANAMSIFQEETKQLQQKYPHMP